MSRIAKQFWVIDTELHGESQGQCSASGPYRSKRAAEAFITADTRNLWEASCGCMQRDDTTPWCKPLHIVEVVRTVQPRIKAIVTLEDIQP